MEHLNICLESKTVRCADKECDYKKTYFLDHGGEPYMKPYMKECSHCKREFCERHFKQMHLHNDSGTFSNGRYGRCSSYNWIHFRYCPDCLDKIPEWHNEKWNEKLRPGNDGIDCNIM